MKREREKEKGDGNEEAEKVEERNGRRRNRKER